MADPDPLDDFVALSALLTGIAADKLHPELDVYQMAEDYLAYATAKGGAAFQQLIALYSANKAQPPAAIAALIFADQASDLAYMAKAVILMWYLGAWYDPAGLRSYYQAAAQGQHPFASSVVISSKAYTQGWVWRVGQTHPMGYSDWRFGYWNTPPQPLGDFIGGN